MSLTMREDVQAHGLSMLLRDPKSFKKAGLGHLRGKAQPSYRAKRFCRGALYPGPVQRAMPGPMP
jgi:hypothetical protein